MTVAELKMKVETYREGLKQKSDKPALLVASGTGPIGISIIDDVVAALESLQQQIDTLKREVDDAGRLK